MDGLQGVGISHHLFVFSVKKCCENIDSGSHLYLYFYYLDLLYISRVPSGTDSIDRVRSTASD